jgi:ATP-dependent protease HslVU (ClpYQ) peptidase subunit
MTRIVGAAAALGYAVGISDVRVTFADGLERDCLQKIYPISRFIAAGFAGSVRIGFTMLQALAEHLRDLTDGVAWIPADVANDFAELGKQVFRASDATEQSQHSHLMLLGAHPTEDVGIPGYAVCSVYILKSPDFVPQRAPIGEVVSIGSGSNVAPYQDVLSGFSSDTLGLLRGEVMGAGMGAFDLTFVMQKTVEQNPTRGISSHAHICVVRRGKIALNTNDENRYPPSGEIMEIRMPPVATSWDEFVQMTSADRQSPHGAIC